METPIYVLVSRQDALRRQMNIVAHNIANASTSGFKGQDVLFENFVSGDTPKSSTHFVLDRATWRDTSQGPLVRTGNPLDLAINGKGYFSVETPQGIQYTRKGSFQLDPEGNLVTSEGYRVLGAEGQAITVPNEATQISIGVDGTVSTDAGDLGRLQPVFFENEQQMRDTYGGYYTSDEAPRPDVSSAVEQGMVENSNINPIAQMAQVIDVQRSYQRTASLLSSENERLRNAIRHLGRPV